MSTNTTPDGTPSARFPFNPSGAGKLLKRLLRYSFIFFFAKGLLWMALLAYPLMKAVQGF